ncbi:hypothetical protein [Halegenticoccus soli]|uniref:hypothetical protein n=1 Tax=Halegenticoccus soli TaxID=1985678 RepID=UPI000C6E87B3|nr:hypothetical protein [Halegenticoccus soli]
MKRRTLLATAAAATGLGLAGCVSDGEQPGTGGNDDEEGTSAEQPSGGTDAPDGGTDAPTEGTGEPTADADTDTPAADTDAPTDGTTDAPADETGTDDATETPTDGSDGASATPSQPSISDRSFAETGDCSEPETAEIAYGESSVAATGCIRGPNGCSAARLNGATLDGGTLEIVVGIEDTRDENEVCTEAIVHLGYEATVEFDGGLPEKTIVIHDGMDGRKTVATAERPA